MCVHMASRTTGLQPKVVAQIVSKSGQTGILVNELMNVLDCQSSMATSSSGQPLSNIRMLVQAPSLGARIVHGCPSHIPFVLPQKRPTNSAMHGAGVVPNDQVSRRLPVNLCRILLLSSVLVQFVNQLL